MALNAMIAINAPPYCRSFFKGFARAKIAFIRPTTTVEIFEALCQRCLTSALATTLFIHRSGTTSVPSGSLLLLHQPISMPILVLDPQAGNKFSS